MTLHPDILTDLVLLYHAGEASQASRALLEEEASRNPRIAAALAAPSRTPPPLPVRPAVGERQVLRKVRLRYQAISFSIVWAIALLVAVSLPRFVSSSEGFALAVTAIPFLLLVLLLVGAVGGLVLIVRALR